MRSANSFIKDIVGECDPSSTVTACPSMCARTNLPDHHIRYLDSLVVRRRRRRHPPFLSLSLSLSSNRETLTLSQFFKRLVAAASGRQAPYMMGLTMSPISILFHCYLWFFFIALFKTIAGILESARSQNSNVNTAVHCAWEGRQRKRESDAAAAALRCDTRGWACCASPQPSTSTGPTLTACMSPCNLCHMKINL